MKIEVQDQKTKPIEQIPTGMVFAYCNPMSGRRTTYLRTQNGAVALFKGTTFSDRDFNGEYVVLGAFDREGNLSPAEPEPVTTKSLAMRPGDVARVAEGEAWAGTILLRTYDGFVDLAQPRRTWGPRLDVTVVPVEAKVVVTG